mmetsp:Transcript_27347/g.78679  ORF Transcript_27347/g.78679 Transcript_27347/m.78679 type:complete len:154 (-) Transcript_27347:430-891(-)
MELRHKAPTDSTAQRRQVRHRTAIAYVRSTCCLSIDESAQPTYMGLSVCVDNRSDESPHQLPPSLPDPIPLTQSLTHSLSHQAFPAYRVQKEKLRVGMRTSSQGLGMDGWQGNLTSSTDAHSVSLLDLSTRAQAHTHTQTNARSTACVDEAGS